MENILLVFLLLCSHFIAKGQEVIDEEYFLFIDEGFYHLKQSDGTLYIYKCLTDFSCSNEPDNQYRIISTRTVGDSKVLKLEQLRPVPLNEIKYTVLTLRNINDKTLSYITEINQYTKSQIDTLQVNKKDLDRKFGFTFYAKEYLKELEKGKQLSTKAEVEDILISLGNPEYQAVVRQYNEQVVERIYSTGVADEIWYRALIKRGYNPIGSKDKAEQLIK